MPIANFGLPEACCSCSFLSPCRAVSANAPVRGSCSTIVLQTASPGEPTHIPARLRRPAALAIVIGADTPDWPLSPRIAAAPVKDVGKTVLERSAPISGSGWSRARQQYHARAERYG